MSQSSLTSIKKHSDKRVLCAICHCLKRRAVIGSYLHTWSLFRPAHYQQYYFMLETHRVTLLNDVISYTIFYLNLKITQCFMVKTQFVCHKIFWCFLFYAITKHAEQTIMGLCFPYKL